MTRAPALPDWRPNAQAGTFPLAPGVSTTTVITPNGAAITEADLSSYRYHHHTKVAVFHGRVWVAYSASGTNEDAGGQKIFVSVATDSGSLSFGAPILAIDAQSTWTSVGASFVATSMIMYPRAFIVSGGTLYLTVAMDKVTGSNNLTGLAVFAVECKSDGTIGAPVRISAASYTPFPTFSVIALDAGLQAALFTTADVFGNWGGSTSGNAASAWTGWASFFGIDFTEPSTVNLDGANALLRFWRRITTPDNRLYAQRSSDGGVTWGSIFRTAIPDSPSATYCYKLSNGVTVIAGNPQDGSVIRDPLYIASFSTNGNIRVLYALRQGLTDAPIYAGTAKIGGAAYPGMWESSGRLLVSHSVHKEDINLSVISTGIL